MTDQVDDEFLYRGRHFTLAGCSAGEPFNPARLGIRPNLAGTACWRGYRSTYGLDGDRLVVAELRLELVADEIDFVRVPGPPINGVEPVEKAAGIDWFNNNYLDLDLPLDYDGGLIIGDGFDAAHGGDLEQIGIWKFDEVIELRFERGRLTRIGDIADLMAPVRQFADRSHERLGDLMREFGGALRNAGSDRERESIRRRIAARRAEYSLDREMDDVAREMLAGKIDPGYLE